MTEPTDPSPVIHVDALTKAYGDVRAVDGISFDAPKGATIGLLGGNGAGKTTTISMLLGLLLPTSGVIRVLGEDMARNRHRALARMNFSSPYVDLPHRLTVRENLMIYARLYRLPRPTERVDEMLEALDLTGLAKRPSGKLSAGQKTRAALAKALLNAPALLLLDEPTASLDPDTGDWMRSYLENYRAETGATILLASHNMAEVERLCDEALIMKAGTIRERGAPKDLIARFGRDTLEDVFLDIARDRKNDSQETRHA